MGRLTAASQGFLTLPGSLRRWGEVLVLVGEFTLPESEVGGGPRRSYDTCFLKLSHLKVCVMPVI